MCLQGLPDPQARAVDHPSAVSRSWYKMLALLGKDCGPLDLSWLWQSSIHNTGRSLLSSTCQDAAVGFGMMIERKPPDLAGYYRLLD